MRLFTLCSYLLTKESYNWWITKRKWGFKQQIFEEKNLKVSVANIWKHSGGFPKHARWLRNFASWRSPFRSQRLISQPAKLAFSLVWSASNGSNFFISTPIHARLKPWITDFPSFKTTYSMHNLSSKKCSKSVQHWLSSWMLHVRFLSLLSLLVFMICLWQRTLKLQSFGFSC